MSTDLRIVVLIVGLILVIVAVVGSLLRMAGRGPALAGAGARLLMGLVGVGLTLGALFATHTATHTRAGTIARSTSGSNGASAVAPPAQPDLIVLAGTAFAGCTVPKQPAAPPDGATATRAQMVASDAQTQAFNAATNAYLACLDKAATEFDRQYGRLLNSSGLQEVAAMQTRIHNTAVTTDQTIADKFNRQLRIYKARGGAT